MKGDVQARRCMQFCAAGFICILQSFLVLMRTAHELIEVQMTAGNQCLPYCICHHLPVCFIRRLNLYPGIDAP
jgi:hypothetical protein